MVRAQNRSQEIVMATIGTFKKSGNELIGEIVTLASRRGTFASSRKPIAPARTPRATASSSAAPISVPPGPSAPTRVAAILGLKLDDPS